MKSVYHYTLLLCVISSSAFLANAQEAKDEIHLSQLVKEAYQRNPKIQAEKARWAQTIETYPQETSLDDPIMNFSYYVEHVETRVGPQNYSLGISQKVPFPGVLKQKGRVVEKAIEIAELKYETAVRDVIADLKQSLFELIYIDGAIETVVQNQQLLSRIEAIAENDAAQEQAGASDLFRAQSQRAQLDFDLINLREMRQVQVSAVNALLDRPIDEKIGAVAAPAPVPVTPTLSMMDHLAMQQNQELRIAQLKIEQSSEKIKLANRMNLPSFTIGANYIDTGDALNPTTRDSGKDPIIVGGGMSIPLWSSKNKARVRYAEQGKTEAANQQRADENSIKVKLRQTLFRLENSRRLFELYQAQLLPQAQHSIEIAEERNRQRIGSIAELLETQSVWQNFNLACLRARTDYAQAWVDLERLCGGSLQPIIQEGEHE